MMTAPTLLAATLALAAPEEVRLVTLGGAVTDIVRELGHGAHIVGVDSTSADVELDTEPEEVGFFRRTSVPGVLSLRPTHVLSVEEAGPPSLFEALKAAGVEVTKVKSPTSVEEAEKRILRIAAALDEKEAGARIVARIKADLEGVTKSKRAPRVLFVYARGPGTLLVAGTKTGPEALVRRAGGTFAVDAFSGFKPFSSEAVLSSAPEVLLMTEDGLQSLGGLEGLRKHPVLGQTPAVKASRVIAMDDLRLLGFGPDLGEVIRELSERFSNS